MHVPVLLEAALDWLRVRPGGTYVDCTAGGGGHSLAIADRMGSDGRLLSIDRDPEAVQRVAERLAPFAGATVVQANYGDLAEVLERMAWTAIDGVLIDAGMSSFQLDEAARGFSFQREGPLDMRMDTTESDTAADLLNTRSVSELADMFKRYGDIATPKRLAQSVVDRRARRPFESTTDFVEAVREAYPFVKGDPDELRTAFQALRIAVNREYESLERGIAAGIDALASEGRIVCISFHSGEDRIVKNAFRDAGRTQNELAPDGRIASRRPPRLRVLTRSPVVADVAERSSNPRAASAKLRAAERRAS